MLTTNPKQMKKMNSLTSQLAAIMERIMVNYRPVQKRQALQLMPSFWVLNPGSREGMTGRK